MADFKQCFSKKQEKTNVFKLLAMADDRIFSILPFPLLPTDSASLFHLPFSANKSPLPTMQTVRLQQILLSQPMPLYQAQVFPSHLYAGPPMATFWTGSRCGEKSELLVIGHRGCGKNRTLTSGETLDPRHSIKENTITSFNMAARNGAEFVEFDVQVTKDGHPVIFHDDEIIAEEQDRMVAKHIKELTLEEFLSIGPQKDNQKAVGRTLCRKSVDGSIRHWTAAVEDCLCTLKEVFEQVVPTVGFNIEIKFDDAIAVPESEIRRTISAILLDVEKYGRGRKIYFSSFHPDAVDVLRMEQSNYPVLFLTEGAHTHDDTRRNSVEAAIDVCVKSGLQGIVSDVKAILQDPGLVSLVKNAGFSLLTYGDLNNVAEAVLKQRELGLDGVIVDHVVEMVTIVGNVDSPTMSSPCYSQNSSNVVLKGVA